MQMRCASRVRIGIGCGLVAMAGWAQATASTELTSVLSFAGNTTWQEIGTVSYKFKDKDSDGILDIGEKVTFTVSMDKDNWGTHRFDAMKIWLDDGSDKNLRTKEFKWNFWEGTSEAYKDHKDDSSFSDKDWEGGAKSFSFSYTFAEASTYKLSVSVMCSRDISGLSGPADDKPSDADWDAWTKNIHETSTVWRQGEDKNYRLTVGPTPPVPEPETYAMLMAGLGLIGAAVRRKKRPS
jgi:hypothetical protein